MQYLTLADVGRFHSARAARTRTNRVSSKINSFVTVAGALNSKGLTVSLRSLDSGSTLWEQTCTRFDDQEFQIIGDIPGHTHGFCDVFAGETNEGLKLVIESHRCYEADPQGNASALKRFYRHALICSRLSHANIVPFLGVFSGAMFPYACIFESVGKDDLSRYLVSNPCAPRLKLLVEVARGLHYIHDLDIVHGNIRGTNIRIDDKGTARIAGFASATLSNITLEDVGEPVETRWYSPELLHPGAFGLTRAKPTKSSDIYAFGMLAYEIFSGRVPFHDRQDVAAIITVITTNERPHRPTHKELSDQLWEMIERCWQKDPSQRPTIREVVTFLKL